MRIKQNLNFKIYLFCIIIIPLKNNYIPGQYTDLVVDLIVLNSKSYSVYCPSGYVEASGCEPQCDLNYKIGGNYIYLCQKKVKFEDLSHNEIPISKIKVNYNSKNCGNLKLIDSDLNAGAGGEYIYLCYGDDEDDPSPISNVFIYIKDFNIVPSGYICDWNDLNKGSSNKQEIYICYYKNKKIPYLIEYSNIEFDLNKKSILEMGEPDEVIYIDNNNEGGDISQTIRRKISKTIKRSYSFNFDQTFNYLNTMSSITPLFLGLTEQISFTAEFEDYESSKNAHIVEEKEEIEYPCIAPARQHLMCKAFNYNYKISIPYNISIIYYYYDGTKFIENYQSELTGIMGSSIQFSKCCIKGCTKSDNICMQEEINNFDSLSGSCPEHSNNKDNSKNNDIVVSDITLISSKNKSIECPFGYEIVNAGCDKEGCDLNFFAGGNYIYLCKKKEKMSALSTNENPVNNFEIVYNNTICPRELKLINVNLNEDAGGDDIYLCYGNEILEYDILYDNSNVTLKRYKYLEPIVDFFIYIYNYNYLPEGYSCDPEWNDLNSGTTKGRSTFLCSTVNYTAFLLKEEFYNRNLGGNIEIVSDLKIINSPNKIITCPYGYEVVNQGCDINGCDLNHKAGGHYIYLCQKKLQFKYLPPKQKPINAIKIINNKNDNQNLNLIDIDLNKGCGGDYIYLTYGYDPESSLSPIVDFFVYIFNINDPPFDYECDSNNLNNNAGGSQIFLCYRRNDYIPREIIINSIDLNYNNSKKITLGLPDKLDEIIVNSASIIKKLEKTVMEEKSMQKSLTYSSSLNISFSFISLVELGFNFDYNFTAGEEWKEAVTKILSTEIECHAEERKKMMCIPFFTNFQLTVPYKASLAFLDYKGRIMKTDNFYGNFQKVSSSQISFKICCLEGCCTGNKELDKDKPQCSEGKADILCNDIQDCFKDK